MTDPCTVAPEGWYCTREAGHDGPCAALPKRPENPTLYDLAKAYVEAVEWDEEHSDDAHSEAGVEMALDYLVAGVKQRIEAAKKIDSPRLMDLNEFRDGGFLQEVNRLFFHPLGLALAVEMDDDETTVTGLWGIYDSRHTGVGFLYDEWSKGAEKKRARVAEERRKHLRAREVLMQGVEESKGVVLSGIQPVGWLPPEESFDGEG